MLSVAYASLGISLPQDANTTQINLNYIMTVAIDVGIRTLQPHFFDGGIESAAYAVQR
jgi:hypothetical protein